MKSLTAIAAAAVLGTASLAMGDYPPSSAAPAGYPPTVQAAQQQSTSTYGQPRPAPRVQVFPFEPVSNTSGLDWVGRGLQQSLQTDVSHTGATLVIAGAAMPPHTTVLEAAKASLANLAVTGTYQVQGDQIRADGQMIDVATGQPVGAFSAKAPLSGIFQLEDAMGNQLQRLLPLDRPAPTIQPTYNTDNAPAGQPSTGTSPSITVVNDPTPSYVDQAPVNVYYSNADSTPYYYPDSFYGGYDYGYPYVNYYSPFAFGVYGGIGYYNGYYRGYRGGYHGNGRGYGGYGYGGGHYAPTFHTSGNGGRSYGFGGGVVSGFHTSGFSSGGGFHGGGGVGGGGFHGGGGGHR